LIQEIYIEIIRPALKTIFWFGRNQWFQVRDLFFTEVSPVVVLGCGRSGTNMVLEILSGHPLLTPTQPDPEDKRLFVPGRRLPGGYLTKCDTHYGSVAALRNLVKLNTQLRIVWTIRDPRDICLSKLRRGVTFDQGGDCEVEADDASEIGCISSIYKMWEMYQFVISHCPRRVYLIRMEDVIDNVEEEARRLSNFVGLDFDKAMCDFPLRMRNEQKKSRYGASIDTTQTGIWRDLETAYGGYFSEKISTVRSVFNEVERVTHYFEYE
jgi:hypothetical protein